MWRIANGICRRCGNDFNVVHADTEFPSHGDAIALPRLIPRWRRQVPLTLFADSTGVAAFPVALAHRLRASAAEGSQALPRGT